METLINALTNVGFSPEQAKNIIDGYEPMSFSRANEIAAQLWFSRWHQGSRLLVWESQAPGHDYFVGTVNVNDALNEHLNPLLQIPLNDAPKEVQTLYSKPNSGKYILYDNGADYRLIGYEYL